MEVVGWDNDRGTPRANRRKRRCKRRAKSEDEQLEGRESNPAAPAMVGASSFFLHGARTSLMLSDSIKPDLLGGGAGIEIACSFQASAVNDLRERVPGHSQAEGIGKRY